MTRASEPFNIQKFLRMCIFHRCRIVRSIFIRIISIQKWFGHVFIWKSFISCLWIRFSSYMRMANDMQTMCMEMKYINHFGIICCVCMLDDWTRKMKKEEEKNEFSFMCSNVEGHEFRRFVDAGDYWDFPHKRPLEKEKPNEYFIDRIMKNHLSLTFLSLPSMKQFLWLQNRPLSMCVDIIIHNPLTYVMLHCK